MMAKIRVHTMANTPLPPYIHRHRCIVNLLDSATELVGVEVVDFHTSTEGGHCQLVGEGQHLGACHPALPGVDRLQMLHILRGEATQGKGKEVRSIDEPKL